MANITEKYCVEILYLKVKGQGHAINKKCGKFDEMCGELKISFSKFPYKFDILGGLFWQQRSAGAVYVYVMLAQPRPTLQD